MVALLPPDAVPKPGDHKGRPYNRQMSDDAPHMRGRSMGGEGGHNSQALNRTVAPLDYAVLVGYRQRANRPMEAT